LKSAGKAVAVSVACYSSLTLPDQMSWQSHSVAANSRRIFYFCPTEPCVYFCVGSEGGGEFESSNRNGPKRGNGTRPERFRTSVVQWRDGEANSAL
jgi:hypothetical protein